MANTNNKLPPAWMGNKSTQPTIPEATFTPAAQPPTTSVVATLPQGTAVNDAHAAVTNKPVTATSAAHLPQATATVPQATGAWQDIVRTLLVAAAGDIVSAGLTNYARDPTDIFALILSESGGKPTAEKKEGYSAKLARDYYSFGLFQMNELTAADLAKRVAPLLGPKGKAKVSVWPSATVWPAATAKTILTNVPDGLWFGIALLRQFLTVMSQNYSSLSTTATAKAGSVAASKATDKTLNALSSKWSVPASAIALKAFWLASSPAGMHSIIQSSDVRLERFATIRRSIKT